MLMDKFKNRYIVKGTIVAETPVHIGAGSESMDPVETDNAVIKDKDGKPYIPGSSLKGALRSWLETFLRGGGNKILGGKTPCLCVNSPCINDTEVKEIKKKFKNKEDSERLVADEIYKRLCIICKVFGSHCFTSKITINDCKLIGERAYIEKRDGVAIDRDTGTSSKNKKYDFEQVSAGTKFDFYMTADNLDSENEKILEVIIKILESGDFTVGGKTSVGLGRIRLYGTKIYRIDENSLENYLFNGLSDEMRWQYV